MNGGAGREGAGVELVDMDCTVLVSLRESLRCALKEKSGEARANNWSL